MPLLPAKHSCLLFLSSNTTYESISGSHTTFNIWRLPLRRKQSVTDRVAALCGLNDLQVITIYLLDPSPRKYSPSFFHAPNCRLVLGPIDWLHISLRLDIVTWSQDIHRLRLDGFFFYILRILIPSSLLLSYSDQHLQIDRAGPFPRWNIFQHSLAFIGFNQILTHSSASTLALELRVVWSILFPCVLPRVWFWSAGHSLSLFRDFPIPIHHIYDLRIQ